MRRLAFVLLLLWPTAQQSPAKPPDPAAALAAAEAKWQKSRPATYEFAIEVTCFCPPPFERAQVFRVTNGVPARIGPGAAPPSGTAWDHFDTIEELFAVVKRYLPGGVRVNVQYDVELGYPRTADLDQAENMADDELRFNVTNFKVVTK